MCGQFWSENRSSLKASYCEEIEEKRFRPSDSVVSRMLWSLQRYCSRPLATIGTHKHNLFFLEILKRSLQKLNKILK